MSDRNQHFLLLLSVIFIRIRFVIAERLSRGFSAGNPHCAGEALLQMEYLHFLMCVWLWRWSLFCFSTKLTLGWAPFGSFKTWELRTAYGAEHLPILWEPWHMLRKKYERPNFHLGRPLYIQNKAHKISKWEGYIFAYEIWRSYHYRCKGRCLDDLSTCLAGRKYNKHNPFTHNTYSLRVSKRSPAHHQRCSVPQAELAVSFMSQRGSTYLGLHSLAACDWANISTFLVMIKFSCPHYIHIQWSASVILKRFWQRDKTAKLAKILF